MNKRSSHGWADLDKAWKSVAELKEELYRTEQKLENAVKNTFGKPKSSNVKQSTSHKGVNGSSKFLKGNKRRKVFSATEDASKKLQEEEWKPKKLVNNWVTHKNDEILSLEDHPKKPPARTAKSNQHELRQKVIESAINSAILRVSSDETSVSSDANHYRTKFNFPKKSGYLSAFNLKDSAIPTKIDATVGENVAVQARQIKFSNWEKEFLDNELSDFEHSDSATNSIALRETKIYYLNDPIAVPKLVSPQDKPRPEPRPLNKSAVTGGLQKLKEIVERQKERQEQTLFNANSDIQMNGNNAISDEDQKVSGNSEFSAKSKHKSVCYSENVQKTDEAKTELKTVDVQIQIKPPPVRKIASVPPPSEYKGFAAQGNKRTKATFRSETGIKMTKAGLISQVPSVSISAEKTSPPKRFKRTVSMKPKEIISPFSWREGQKMILKHLGPPPSFCVTLNQKCLAEKDSRVDNKTSFSQIQSSPDHTLSDSKAPVHGNVEKEGLSKEKPNDILLETDVETIKSLSENQLSPTKEILKNLLTKVDESNDEILSENDLTSQHKYVPKASLSKKRKAIKQPEPEQRTPGPKIRHYDPEKVRVYIQKQKAQRKKKLQEERQKKMQAQQAKSDRLQQLYNYQKEAAKIIIKPKILQPLKVRN